MKRSIGSGTGRRAKRTFSAEFKRGAVELMRRRRAEGVSMSQVARELDIGPALLWEWDKRLDGESDRSSEALPGETPEQELRRLRRENAILREERAFAKKALVFFAKESP
jgi:transposase